MSIVINFDPSQHNCVYSVDHNYICVDAAISYLLWQPDLDETLQHLQTYALQRSTLLCGGYSLIQLYLN